jgi:hypothetical protein
MALTWTNRIGVARGVRTYKLPGGLRIDHVEITVGLTADYSTTAGSEGFDVPATMQQLGLRDVFSMASISIRTSAGDHKHFLGSFDYNTRKIRFFKTGTAVSIAFLEIVPGTDLAVGDIVSAVVFGI